MKTILLTGPALSPVSLAEAKAHLHLESSFTTDDSDINADILTATEIAESITFRRLISQTWKMYLGGWTGRDPNRYFPRGFYIPYGQLQSVTHIKYTDTDGDQTTWDADTEYDVDTYAEPGAVALAYNKSFPTAQLYPMNPIEIQFITGWFQGPLRVKETAYALLDTITPSTQTGFVYECTTAGTSAATEPTFGKTVGGTTTDGTVTWTCRKAVPSMIKKAILLMVSDQYELRETNIIGQGVTVMTLNTITNMLIKQILWEF